MPRKTTTSPRSTVTTSQAIFSCILGVGLCLFSPWVVSADITEHEARAIALRNAPCPRADSCEIRGGWQDGKWVFVVSFITGRTADGKPQFTPGGWIGITVNRAGEIINRTPGA